MRTDIFGLAPRQHNMFGTPEPTLDAPMITSDIRDELTCTVARLEEASAMPWPIRQMQTIETMFPDLAARLPPGEGGTLLSAFRRETRRLGRDAA